MPIYDFKCNKCEKELKDEFTHSWKEIPICCDQPMERLFPTRAGRAIFPDEGITLDHVAAKPVHFDSYKEMKKYARDHDLELSAAL